MRRFTAGGSPMPRLRFHVVETASLRDKGAPAANRI